MNSSESEPAIAPSQGRLILWRQVCSLAALQGAITLCWLIYNSYLPQLLVQLGFSAALASGLLIAENALAAVMEPLAGGLSDRAYGWLGTRFPFISLGVILSSALLIAIPTSVIFGSSSSGIRWSLPIVAIAWALAMTIFRSPAISLLGRYAPVSALPLAGSLLTLVGGIIGAFRPFSQQFILHLGPAFAFTIGSIVLLAAVGVLRSLHPPETLPPNNFNSPEPLSIPILGLIFTTGVGLAWGFRFLLDVLAKMLKTYVSEVNLPWLMFAFFIAVALAAVPAGAWATRVGNRQGLLAGMAATIALLCLMVLIPSLVIVIVAAIGLVVSFSLVSNGAVPFALEILPQRWAGLAVGLYFGGFSAGSSLFGYWFPQLDAIAIPVVGIWGAIAFSVAIGSVFFSYQLKSNFQS